MLMKIFDYISNIENSKKYNKLNWDIGGRLEMAPRSKFGPHHGFIHFLLFDPQQRHLHIWNIYWFVI